MTTLWIISLLLLLVVVLLTISYNKLVRDHQRVLSGWSDIEVQLQRRHALIPKLVAAVKQYAQYEQATLQTLTTLRQQAQMSANVDERGALENKLRQGLINVYAVAEKYPDLKSNRQYLDLQQQISAIEKDIHFARRYYNGAVNNWNTRLQTFPDLIVAQLLRYRPAQYFEYHETA